MDSASGSMQSSSGGDEEYDSRAESSISAFFNNNPPPPQQTTHVLVDPLSNYLDPIQRSHPNQNSVINLDMVWSKAVRSEPNQADLNSLIPPQQNNHHHNHNAFLLSQLSRGVSGIGSTTQHSLPVETSSSGGRFIPTNNDQSQSSNTNTNMVRNPKKRSRASRRAPTTVLTTDTTNFRAMVQEFTGIPAPPFTSSPFPRARLDLFGSAPPIRSSSTHLDPPYLLRPFAQKLQPQPQQQQPHSSFPLSSSMVDSTNNTLLVANNSTTNNNSSTNYQLPSSQGDHLGLLKQQQQHSLNMHNSLLNFQSILQPPLKYTVGNSSSLLASKTTQPSLEIPLSSVDSHLKMGVLEELGLSHVNTHGGGGIHHNMVHSSSDGALARVNNSNNMRINPSLDWTQRITGTIGNSDGGGGVLRSLSGAAINNYRSNVVEERGGGVAASNGKDFHGEKGPECGVAARSEGTVESWINCSSE